jgi:hypothetical protein
MLLMCSLHDCELSAELEMSVKRLKASEIDLQDIVDREIDYREVAEYKYAQMRHECIKWMELREASELDLVCCYKSLQKLNEDCEKLRASPRPRSQDCWSHIRVGPR